MRAPAWDMFGPTNCLAGIIKYRFSFLPYGSPEFMALP
jgi:hypothetical protein